ncbi:cell wall metabolism sensor histidine kinase WalK [Roseibium sp. MMSF_3412]|uniref:sensor histidine kinase n=1 Tax=Roseibium sp. MMSF_3412 TaxID=3046712 RepID=UPI00273DFD44|nr:HAMP domain-containing sensor histidine kinase [Roseibium sp. MMSF_3412]
MKHRLHRIPWLTLQIIAANTAIVLMLGIAWYWLFLGQSTTYSDRLMSTFNIEPGQVHAMFVDEVERQLWTSISIGLVFAVAASIGVTLLIVRPLGVLARTTDRLRQGDYSVRAKTQSGEVGQLADTVNALAAALQREEERRARYLADLGHELRTPITSLRGYTEGLEDGVFQADTKFFSLMSDELNHLTTLTHSIEALELSPDDEDPECTGADVAFVLEDLRRRWQTQFRAKSLQLSVDADEPCPDKRIALSQKSLRHIIDNLMSNMLRYADADTDCRVVVSRHGPQGFEMVFSNGARDLPAQDVPLLFDRFFRVSHSRTRDRDTHSSGLGLSIVKQLCLGSGGSVHAEIHEGRLSFVVRLPLLEAGPARGPIVSRACS